MKTLEEHNESVKNDNHISNANALAEVLCNRCSYEMKYTGYCYSYLTNPPVTARCVVCPNCGFTGDKL